MAQWHGYFAAQQLTIDAAQWGRLQGIFESWGPLNDTPACMLHTRRSLAGDIVIYEAAFNTDDVSMTGFRQALATEFGVEPGDVGVTANDVTFVAVPSPFWVFDYLGQNRFRAGVFAGLSGTRAQSLIECAQYLANNRAAWEPTLT